MRVEEMLEALASDSGPPAGGSAAAIIVAIAAGVTGMTARISRSRWDEAGGAAAQAAALRARVAPLAQADADAYSDALEAMRASSGASKDDRDRVIGETLARAADTPLRIAVAGADVAELAAVTAAACNPDLRADAVAAALYADAGARAAARMVDVNLATTENDPRRAEARAAADRARTAAEQAQGLGQ
jgi:formiminotetrahydrofolate cyclodeaminase